MEDHRLRGLMVDAAPALIAYVDKHERYRQANAAYQRWFGIKPEDLIGRTVSELFGESLYRMLKPRIDRVLSGEQIKFEERYPSGDSGGIILQVTYSPDFDKAGGVQGFTVLGSDITARRDAEESVRLSEERWKNIFERMAEGFFLGEMLYDSAGIARDFRFLELNPSFERLTGLCGAAGRTAMEIIPGLQAEIVEAYARVVETGVPEQFEMMVPSLQNRWYQASARRTEGRRFSVLFSDVTERKQSEQERRTSEARMSALTILGEQLRDPRDVPSIVMAAMEVVGKALGVARAGYGVIDRSGEYVTIENDWNAKGAHTIAGTYRFRDFGEGLGDQIQRGQILVVNDSFTNPMTAHAKPRWEEIGIRALINMPLMENSRPSAVLFLHDSEPRQWTDADLLFVRKAADRTWAAVERARALKELEESEEFTRSVLESSPDCVKVLDLRGNLVSINRAGCVQLEIDDLSTCLDRPWADLWQQEARSVPEAAILKACAGETVRFEGFCPTVKGAGKWWEIVVTPVRDAMGQTVRILALSRDISGRRKAEHEREHLTDELRRSNEDLSSFAHIVAHDLQSPLRGLTSFAQLIERDATETLTTRQREFLSHIVDNAARMRTLVDALLRFAQVGQGQLQISAVALGSAVDTALHNLRMQIEESRAVIRRGALPFVSGDPVQLTQLLQNLVGNALKYRKVNVTPSIGIYVKALPDEVVVSVEDNGEGIAEDQLHKIFEPLKRLHGAEIPGSGLGLSVCRKIVERHGGRIWVESKPGVGSTFFFSLQPA